MFTDKYNNNLKTYVDITNVKKQLEILEKEQSTRIYKPRVLNDLKVSEKFKNTKDANILEEEKTDDTNI